MILLDTSAWIHHLNHGGLSFEDLKKISVCPPVIQEILQGIRGGRTYRTIHDGLLAIPCLSDPISLDIYIEASEIFRLGRQKGITIRSSIDCLIAAIAIFHKIVVYHRDRDFDLIAKFTGLSVVHEIK